MEKLYDTLILLCNYNKYINYNKWDFNYEIFKHQHNPQVTEFLNVMYTNFLQPNIFEPTRVVAYNRSNLADNIFINTFGNLAGNLT